METASFQNYHTHYFDEIAERVEPGDELRPARHAVDGRIQSAEQVKDHYKKERKGHGLLLRFGIGGDQQAHPENGEEVYGKKSIQQPHASERNYPIDKP